MPDLQQGVLRVHVHPMSTPRSNRAIAHLLEHLNAAEFPYPGTNLRLVYSIAGEPETPNLAPHQNPADQEVWAWAVAQDRPVLTRDHEDFADLHDLVMAVGDHHPGILVVRFDNDPRHNLTERAIATAIGNLESSGVAVVDRIHVLNHWC